jgi:hypothetical protein
LWRFLFPKIGYAAGSNANEISYLRVAEVSCIKDKDPCSVSG